MALFVDIAKQEPSKSCWSFRLVLQVMFVVTINVIHGASLHQKQKNLISVNQNPKSFTDWIRVLAMLTCLCLLVPAIESAQ